MAALLDQHESLDQCIQNNRKRLAELYSYVVAFLDDHGIPYARGSTAAFFVWCDLLTPYLKIGSSSSHDESAFTEQASSIDLKVKLALQKAHLGDGDECGAERPGWFRITFSQHRGLLNKGLKQIIQALHSKSCVGHGHSN